MLVWRERSLGSYAEKNSKSSECQGSGRVSGQCRLELGPPTTLNVILK